MAEEKVQVYAEKNSTIIVSPTRVIDDSENFKDRFARLEAGFGLNKELIDE